ncbi:MAG: response regulator transcription factor [Dehalococcoidales bacterium]|nr:MAG: response regulator transcription factor [Dehalococcoidales bacterium]
MRVLVIDDDPDVARVISLCFKMRWPQTEVVSAVDGTEGLLLVKNKHPDVVILDIGLPEMNGYEVCYKIRSVSDVPIIMLTVRDADTDISCGLEVGADDYITKPFSHIQLLSRVQAVMRRTHRLPVPQGKNVFYNNNLKIDFDNHEVSICGELIKLTPIEYGLLYHLSHNVGRVMTYQTLLSKIWGEEYVYETNLLKVHVHNLRNKLHDNPESPVMIINERGIGYRLLPGNMNT